MLGMIISCDIRLLVPILLRQIENRNEKSQDSGQGYIYTLFLYWSKYKHVRLHEAAWFTAKFKLCPWGDKEAPPTGAGGHLFYIEQKVIGNDWA